MNPAATSDTIVQEITIKGSAERIFDALIKWVMRGTGYGKAVTVMGEYRQIERPRVLVFTWLPDWQGDATESTVRFDLDERDGVTTVRLTHSGLITENSRTSHKGWPQILTWLQAYVEHHV